jgi:hypothetical protein
MKQVYEQMTPEFIFSQVSKEVEEKAVEHK